MRDEILRAKRILRDHTAGGPETAARTRHKRWLRAAAAGELGGTLAGETRGGPWDWQPRAARPRAGMIVETFLFVLIQASDNNIKLTRSFAKPPGRGAMGLMGKVPLGQLGWRAGVKHEIVRANAGGLSADRRRSPYPRH